MTFQDFPFPGLFHFFGLVGTGLVSTKFGLKKISLGLETFPPDLSTVSPFVSLSHVSTEQSFRCLDLYIDQTSEL